VDPHHVDADPDSTYHPDADPDADPDSGFLFDADSIRHFILVRIRILVQMIASKIKAQTLEIVLKYM
jgi:hypothetical protein